MDASEPEELFNLSDFESIDISITFENLTANTGVKDSMQTFGEINLEKFDSSAKIRVMEFLANGVCLDVPSKIASAGHSVRLVFDVMGVQLPFVFEAKGQVAEITQITPERDKFVIQFSEINSRYYDALKNLYADRQKQVEALLFQMKG